MCPVLYFWSNHVQIFFSCSRPRSKITLKICSTTIPLPRTVDKYFKLCLIWFKILFLLLRYIFLAWRTGSIRAMMIHKGLICQVCSLGYCWACKADLPWAFPQTQGLQLSQAVLMWAAQKVEFPLLGEVLTLPSSFCCWIKIKRWNLEVFHKM